MSGFLHFRSVIHPLFRRISTAKANNEKLEVIRTSTPVEDNIPSCLFPPTHTSFKSKSFSMSVVGIDFGYQNSVIAAAGRGGVDVILNGASNRLNPYVVVSCAFGPWISIHRSLIHSIVPSCHNTHSFTHTTTPCIMADRWLDSKPAAKWANRPRRGSFPTTRTTLPA
jgi:hypothetical protein